MIVKKTALEFQALENPAPQSDVVTETRIWCQFGTLVYS